MALITCPECSKQVSDQVTSCIHCGFPLRRKDEVIFQLDQAPSVPPIKDSQPAGSVSALKQGFKDGLAGKPRVTVIDASTVKPQAIKTIADEVRAGNAQAEHNKNAQYLFGVQLLILSALAGVDQNSWVVFGVVFLVLAVLINIPYLGKLIGFAMAIACGLGVYKLGVSLGMPEAGGVIGVFIGIGFAGANVAFPQHVKDLNSR